MHVSIGRRPDPLAALDRLGGVLDDIPDRVVACSGGIDSLVLATVAHSSPGSTRVAHTATPAVPGDATARVVDHADRKGWHLDVIRSGEFDDERYLANPTERCYFCKSNLYDAIGELLRSSPGAAESVVLSGANTDDLGEFRPGLEAAAERSVRHPFVEAAIGKADIRAIARHLGMPEADLPASPCLASRLYTGTRVTAGRLRAVEAGEALVRDRTGLGVVRCRVRDDDVSVEVPERDRVLVTAAILADVADVMRSVEPSISSVVLDAEPYAPGRSFLHSDSRPASASVAPDVPPSKHHPNADRPTL
ncbi:MAG: ATPase [Actinomycetota bacterium]